jgi:HEAT repeat protein
MAKAFPLFILCVVFVCVSVAGVFIILSKYRGSETNQAKSEGASDIAYSSKIQDTMVQMNTLSPSQSADNVNSISGMQAPAVSGINRRYSSGEVNASLSAETRQAVSEKKEKDVSAILSVLTGRQKEGKLSSEEIEKKFAILLDKDSSLKDCREAAWLLAKGGDAKTLSVLRQVALDANTAPELKAAIIEGIAYSDDPQKKELLLSALADKDDAVARAAIRGFSAIGDLESVDILTNIARSPDKSSDIVSEAITGIGKSSSPAAYQVLVDLYNESADRGDSDSQEEIITAMGQRNISQTGQFFEQILRGKESDPALRLAAAESLEWAQGDVSPLLVNMLHDENSEIRAAAAWSLAAREEPGDVLGEIQAVLMTETDPQVRTRLYQAMGNQENVNIDVLAPKILNEPDSEARAAGYDLLAKNIGSSENAELKRQFDKMIVPQLKETALNAEELNSKLAAIISLKKADTEQAYLALKEITAQSKDSSVIEAAGMLK